mmetsp:Transcript_16811/g.31503  ORF Transcript_16811/g.31503 Transcript_16811/m.31503 type:complete len:273 (+) Transcript_16811:279-1097(+)
MVKEAFCFRRLLKTSSLVSSTRAWASKLLWYWCSSKSSSERSDSTVSPPIPGESAPPSKFLTTGESIEAEEVRSESRSDGVPPAESSLNRLLGLQKFPLLLRLFSTLSRALSSRSLRLSICFLQAISSLRSSDSVSKATFFSFASSSRTSPKSLLAFAELFSASCSSCSSCSISSSIIACSSLLRFFKFESCSGASCVARFSTLSLFWCSACLNSSIFESRDAICALSASTSEELRSFVSSRALRSFKISTSPCCIWSVDFCLSSSFNLACF